MFHKVQVPAGIGLLQDQMLQLILEMEQDEAEKLPIANCSNCARKPTGVIKAINC